MGVSEVGAAARPQPLHWTRIAERGSLWGLRFTVWCYRVLGRRISLGLVYCVVTYFFATDPTGRRASLAYLRRVHRTPAGRATLGGAPGWREVYRHYRSFALSIVDRLAIWFGDAGHFEFESHGVERYEELAEQGRGAIILGAHLGSFDALRLLAERTGSVVNVLMFTANARRINAIFRELAPESEERLISVDPHSVQSVFAVRERLRRGEHVAILADRIEAGERNRSASVPLLGGPVDLPLAPILLAGLLDCPLFVMVALRTGAGRYRVISEELAPCVPLPREDREEAARAYLEAYALALERFCLMAPYQWFNFFDYWGEAGEAGTAAT